MTGAIKRNIPELSPGDFQTPLLPFTLDMYCWLFAFLLFFFLLYTQLGESVDNMELRLVRGVNWRVGI